MTQQSDKLYYCWATRLLALGAIHAGLSGVYAYPGTPSTEITEYIQENDLARQREIFCRWCTNEEDRHGGGSGMSYMGKRAMVCMKHVGLNVAADAFVNSAHHRRKRRSRGACGRRPVDALVAERAGLALLRKVCPHAHSRTFVATGGLRHDGLCLRPVGRDETAHTHARYHPHGPTSRAVVKCGPVREPNAMNNNAVPANFILLPVNARRRYASS